jgi:hypothetical protein
MIKVNLYEFGNINGGTEVLVEIIDTSLPLRGL